MSLGPGKGPSAIVMAAGAVEKAQLPGIFLLAARPQAGQEMSGASWAFFRLPAVGASPAGIHTKNGNDWICSSQVYIEQNYLKIKWTSNRK